MASELAPHVLKILSRHTNEKIFVVYCNNNSMAFSAGKFISAKEESMTIRTTDDKLLTIHFFSEGEQVIFHIYNSSFIDIITGKTTSNLQYKIGKMSAAVIKALKPHLKKEMFFVFKSYKDVGMVHGSFEDLGINGVVLKAAPFFNEEVRLQYSQILHIYNTKFIDLIDI